MIRTFRQRGVEKFFRTGSKAGIQPKHEARLRILLTTLNPASTPLDMNRDGWDWHALKGDLKGHWSVSVKAFSLHVPTFQLQTRRLFLKEKATLAYGFCKHEK